MTHTDSNRFLSGLGKNPAGVRAKPWTAGRPLRARSWMHRARAKPSAQGGDECIFGQHYDTNDFGTSDTLGWGNGKNGLLLRIICPFLIFFPIPTPAILSVQSPLALGIIQTVFKPLRRRP